MLPRTVDGMEHVCFFRHALALDERRVKFLPEYAYGGSATCGKSGHQNPSSVNQESSEQGNNPSDEIDRSQDGNKVTVNYLQTWKDWIAGAYSYIFPIDKVDRLQGGNKVTVKHPQTLEVWFAGTHSDM